MPAISLPTININHDDFKSKETMENILDTLMKYRKELNFLLMNLDGDNMPVIQENMDGLYGRMETVDGRVSEFIQTVDGFQTTVSNYQGEVSQFTQTVDGFNTTVANYQGQLSTFTQTVSGFQTTVSNYAGQVSAFTQTVNGFQTQVSSYASQVGTFNSTITQLSNEVSSIVSFTDATGNQIASKINQTATNISISASKIDLTGVTTIYNTGNSNYYTTMTGTGIRIQLGSELFAILKDSISGWYINTGGEPLYLGKNGNNTYFESGVHFTNATVHGLELRFA